MARKVALSVMVEPALTERVRNAAYWERITLGDLVTQAVTELIDRMEKERGEPYPPRKGELRPGRPTN